MFLRGCEFMLFCNNLYTFCGKMLKNSFKFLWWPLNLNVPTFFLNASAFWLKRRGIPLSFSLPYYICPKVSTRARLGLLTLYFYSLNNKNETLKDWKNVKKYVFWYISSFFSLKKIGYILKIHNFAPWRIKRMY